VRAYIYYQDKLSKLGVAYLLCPTECPLGKNSNCIDCPVTAEKKILINNLKVQLEKFQPQTLINEIHRIIHLKSLIKKGEFNLRDANLLDVIEFEKKRFSLIELENIKRKKNNF
jgi:hypothetical protein